LAPIFNNALCVAVLVDHVAEASIKVPTFWEKQQEDLSVVQLKPSDPEYQQVEKNFNDSVGTRNVKVTRVCMYSGMSQQNSFNVFRPLSVLLNFASPWPSYYHA
jgi:hypothetical protein